MIWIIRLKTDGEAKKLWADIIDRKDSLQEALGKKGRLLYLAKRVGFNEASLFVHADDLNSVSELVVDHMSQLEGVSGTRIIHLFRPRFFPVPEDTYDMKRFVVSIKVSPSKHKEVYKKLLNPNLPDGLRKVYYAFTFHQYDEDLQYSLLAEDKESVDKYVAENINTMDGILKAEVYQAEKSKPFISYKQWLEYTSEGNSVPAWHHYMENHFDFVEETTI